MLVSSFNLSQLQRLISFTKNGSNQRSILSVYGPGRYCSGTFFHQHLLGWDLLQLHSCQCTFKVRSFSLDTVQGPSCTAVCSSLGNNKGGGGEAGQGASNHFASNLQKKRNAVKSKVNVQIRNIIVFFFIGSKNQKTGSSVQVHRIL